MIVFIKKKENIFLSKFLVLNSFEIISYDFLILII